MKYSKNISTQTLLSYRGIMYPEILNRPYMLGRLSRETVLKK